MKKLLYIGHTYHKKTKSADFCKSLISEEYEVTDFYFDPYHDDMTTHFNNLQGEVYDIVVLWQIMPHLDELKKVIKFKKSVFFPMYDGVPNRQDPIWYEYRNTQIICFCKVLHNELKELGFSSHYIQYFPKPADIKNQGDEKSVFFWQRINQINIHTVESLLKESSVERIHIHKALDPQHEFVEPSSDTKWKITYSTWFDTKEEMLQKQQESAIYIAPRLLEGIGMSFLEAMAMGRCVIAPNNPTMNEYIKDGVTGYLYDPSNPQPLALDNIREIQQNTLKYISDGYQKWEKEKYKILDWIEEKIVIDKKKIKIHFKEKEKIIVYKLFSVLPLIALKKNHRRTKLYLLGYVPFLTIRENKDVI